MLDVEYPCDGVVVEVDFYSRNRRAWFALDAFKGMGGNAFKLMAKYGLNATLGRQVRRGIIVFQFNSLWPRPNRRHFADDIFECIFENENE